MRFSAILTEITVFRCSKILKAHKVLSRSKLRLRCAWRARSGLYQCGEKECGKQFTVTVNTIFHDSHLPLTKWFLAIYLIAESSKGVSANSLKKLVGVTYKTAWYLGHRIRKMMEVGDATITALSGVVELDETYVGGKSRRGDPPAKRGRGTKKHGVFVAVQWGGEVRAAVMDSMKFADMKTNLDQWVDPTSMVMTDEFKAYKPVKDHYRYHFTVTHGDDEFARDGIQVNNCESSNATLKRAVIGVYHYMSRKHLIRYVNEACFRWNGRKTDTAGRMAQLIMRACNQTMPYSRLISAAPHP